MESAEFDTQGRIISGLVRVGEGRPVERDCMSDSTGRSASCRSHTGLKCLGEDEAASIEWGETVDSSPMKHS